MSRVRAQRTLCGGRVESVACLERQDAEFGVEAGGDGAEVGGAGGRVAGQGAVGVEFEVAD